MSDKIRFPVYVTSAPLLAALILLSSCGLTKNRYEKYAPAGSSSDSNALALAVFEERMAASVDATCATAQCHATSTINEKTLVKGDASNNRDVLWSYAQSDDLVAKLDGTTGHGGGVKITDIGLENINAWLEAERSAGGSTVEETETPPATEEPPTSPPAVELTEAQIAFNDKVKSGVDQSCALSGCHGSTPIGQSSLEVGADDANRLALKAYVEAGNDLFGKYSGTSAAHGGGDQSSILPQANLNQWLSAEGLR